ncbi:MAG TPA: hypothetical protein DCG79_04275 [Clostridiales bacterium]|nr:hypothetical protein [Clostridiales bacterium]
MQRMIFAVVIVLLIVGLGVFEQVYISRLYEDTEAQAEQVKAAVQEDVESALPVAEKLKENWLEKRSFLEAVTPHNETKEMVLRIAELIGYVEAKDDKSALATAEIILEMCQNTPHILGFHWEHIF